MKAESIVSLCVGIFSLAACVTNDSTGDELASAPAQHSVSFESNGVELQGTVSIPAGQGPFPGAVLIHGSGSSDRSNPWTDAYQRALVERGIAVLHPDKRGSGQSGGDWRVASFDLLADDAIAAVRAMQAQPGVAADRVGLIGFSQGGHVAPLAAARTDRVDFVVSVSSSVVPILEQVGDEVRLMAGREGIPASGIDQFGRLHDLAVAWLRGDGRWDDYASALHAARTGEFAESSTISGFPDRPDDPGWSFLRAVDNDGPLDEWRSLSVPIAFIYGGNDGNVDVAKSVEQIQSVLGPTDSNYVLLLLGSNGHALFRDDALDFIATWIRDGGAS